MQEKKKGVSKLSFNLLKCFISFSDHSISAECTWIKMPWYRKFIRIASFLVPSWICEHKMRECLVNSSPNHTESPSVFKYFGCFATIQLWWKTEVRTVSVFYSGAVWKDGATMGLWIVDSENWQWVICLPVVWGQCRRAQLEIPRVLLGSSCYLKGISRAARGGVKSGSGAWEPLVARALKGEGRSRWDHKGELLFQGRQNCLMCGRMQGTCCRCKTG